MPDDCDNLEGRYAGLHPFPFDREIVFLGVIYKKAASFKKSISMTETTTIFQRTPPLSVTHHLCQDILIYIPDM